MQTTAKTTRFLTASSFDGKSSGLKNAVSLDELIQSVVLARLAQTVHSRQGFVELASYLVRVAEHAYSLRDMNTVQEVGEILASLPLDFARQTGLYYQALTLKRAGQIDKAKGLLEVIADNAPFVYRGRAIQTLGRIHHEQGQLDEALRLHLEAVRVTSQKNGCDPLIMLLAHSEISHVKSDIGDHYSALGILENLSALVQIVGKENPFYFYTYHNELAFELAESGRVTEAYAALSIALASPYAHAYPEWSETREEIAAKRETASPSVVFITRDLNAESSIHAQPRRVCVLDWTVPDNTSSNTSPEGVITAPTALLCLTRTILDRLGKFINPRAPPIHS
jgi:tetratricopeptide (TPR) repeat protein